MSLSFNRKSDARYIPAGTDAKPQNALDAKPQNALQGRGRVRPGGAQMADQADFGFDLRSDGFTMADDAPANGERGMTPLELPRGLGRPAERALEAAGIHDLSDLTRHSREEISELHGIGPKAIGVLVTALAMHGLSFRATP